jgi:hypothetical protein
LPIEASNSRMHKAESLIHLGNEELDNWLQSIKSNTNVPSDKSANAIKIKLNLLNYIGTLCYESSQLANLLMQADLHIELLQVAKNGHNLEM